MGRRSGRSGVPVFLDRGIGDMTDVLLLFELLDYAFATKKLRSATIKSHLSGIKFFIDFHAGSSSTQLTSRAP